MPGSLQEKTAYEISRSDWSSDVCSSDLDNYKIVCYLKAFSSISNQVFELKSTDFTIDRSKDKKIAVGYIFFYDFACFSIF